MLWKRALDDRWALQNAARLRRLKWVLGIRSCSPRNATHRLAREQLADKAGDHCRAFRGRREYGHDGAASVPIMVQWRKKELVTVWPKDVAKASPVWLHSRAPFARPGIRKRHSASCP
jgi:hypothetical protein